MYCMQKNLVCKEYNCLGHHTKGFFIKVTCGIIVFSLLTCYGHEACG